MRQMIRRHFYRPFDHNPNALRYRKHPAFCLTRLRGTIAQHSQAEEAALERYANGRKSLVEIGVAEGASALALRRVADPEASLYLVDPYPTGRIPGLNFTKLCAERHLNQCSNATVVFLNDFSFNVAKRWNTSIDFLFIDGEHSYDACLKDWQDWSPFVEKGGIVAFHDARVFLAGWVGADWGPVKVVNRLFRDKGCTEWQIVEEVDSLVVVKRV